MIRNLYLVRGVSGAGKSTLALAMAAAMGGIAVANDDFFTNHGEYVFDHTKHKEAKQWCEEKVEHYLQCKIGSVVVHNTFTREWELEPYMDLAETYGYRVTTLVVENRHGSVNTHGVPSEVIDNMKERFEVQL